MPTYRHWSATQPVAGSIGFFQTWLDAKQKALIPVSTLSINPPGVFTPEQMNEPMDTAKSDTKTP
jgi:hypothetical protein